MGFTWETRVRGLCFSATHELGNHPAGTASLLSLEVGGLLATQPWPALRYPMVRSLERENAGL